MFSSHLLFAIANSDTHTNVFLDQQMLITNNIQDLIACENENVKRKKTQYTLFIKFEQLSNKKLINTKLIILQLFICAVSVTAL